MPLQCFAQEPLRGSEVSPLAEPELNGVTIAVDGPLQVPPLTAHLDIGFVDMPPATDRALAPIELLQ